MSKPGNQNGVAYDLPFSEYLASPGVSNSRLRKIHRSPQHYRDAVSDEAPHLTLGRMVHAGVLEGDVALMKWQCATGSSHDDQLREAGFEIISREMSDNAWRIINRVRQHRLLGSILDSTPKREVTAWHRDEETGIIRRCRFDAPSTIGVLLDFKTINEIGEVRYDSDGNKLPPKKVERHLAEFGYHEQADQYLEVANHTVAKEPGYQHFDEQWLAFVETKPPHGIYIAQIGPRSLETARVRNRRALRLLAECERTGEWPTYTENVDDIQTIEIPHYLQETA